MKKFVPLILIFLQCSVLCAEPVRVGTTFSPRQCEYLDLDWKKTYLSVLELGFDIIRLGAYWSEIEKEENIYDFSSLDWQISQAREKGLPVILTVGMKAPRWPEYFIPDWVLEKTHLPFGADVSKNEFLRERTLKFIKKTIDRYKDEESIHYWQVENEALNRIGEKHWFIGKDFLKQEVELVRELDRRKRPVLLTAATYPNKILRFMARLSVRHDPIKECLSLCDIIGLNVYPMIGHKLWSGGFYFRTTRKEMDKYFSKLLTLAKNRGKKTWIVELQAEPWEPGHLVYKPEEIPATERPDVTIERFREFRKLGVDTILLWGAEYWVYRQARYGDTRWREVLKELEK
ncbi:MAG: beta-galactosidase [Candidatus Omnitrophota bacterium]